MTRHSRGVRLALFAFLLMSTLSGRGGGDAHRQPAQRLEPGVDYAQGEVIVFFKQNYMPSESQVSGARDAFGIRGLDSLLAFHGTYRLKKLLPTYDRPYKSSGARLLQRCFVIKYSGFTDAQDIVSALLEEPYFELVKFNRILSKEYYGLKRYVPPTNTEFGRQWYFDDARDKIDIDMPEAWAVEKGDPTVVVVINDSGTMIDTCRTASDCQNATDWTIHGDFNHYWIAEEDSFSSGVLNRYDIKFTDSNGDDVDDNIIGANFAPGFEADTAYGYQYRLGFWHAMPIDLLMSSLEESLTTWDCTGYQPHAVRVGSIAAGRISNSPVAESSADIVGAAPYCRVYWVRAGLANDTPTTTEADEAAAIAHAALYADVINMSWGFNYLDEDPGPPFSTAIETAVNEYNCVLVAAVGNDGARAWVPFPARYPSVLAVGAVDTLNLSLTHKSGTYPQSGYSDYDSTALIVDVVAPVDRGIWTDSHSTCEPTGCPCKPTEEDNRSNIGTSFAAPQATGIAALIRSMFPNLAQDSVRARIKRAAEYYAEWTNETHGPNKYGAGKINAYRSVTEWGRVATDSTTHIAVWGESEPDTFYVSGDLIIEESDTLVLASNTVVRVAPLPIKHNEGDGPDTNKVEIIVRGTLRTETTGGSGVRFESFADSVTGADWAGIRFEPGSRGILKNVVIANASQDVEIEDFNISVSDWNENKTLCLNSSLAITSDFTVDSDETLYVLGDNPVVATGGSSIGIDVEGTLVCRGLGTERPEFRSSTEEADDWDGIRFDSTSTNNVLKNFIVRDAVQAIRNYAPLEIDTLILSGGTEGVEAHEDLDIRSADISGFSAYGIQIVSGLTRLEDVTISDCGIGADLNSLEGGAATLSCTTSVIRDLEFHGITANSHGDSAYVANSTIENGVYGLSLLDGAKAFIEACAIKHNDTGVLGIGTPEVEVTGCDIDSNTTNGIYAYDGSAMMIAGNTIAHSGVGVFCQTNSAAVIEDENWIKNHAIGIKCDDASPAIRFTKISNNTVGIAALNDADPDIGAACEDTCEASGCGTEGANQIVDNSSHHIVNLSQSVTVMAECNYWGSRGPSPSKFSGSVDYTPYRTTDPLPNLITARPPEEGDGNEDELQNIYPEKYSLSGGVPNPFNPETTVRVGVPRPGGSVVLVVYNVRGQLVRTLVRGTMPVGYNEVTWDGRDDRGVPVASGIYFVQMRAKNFKETKKMAYLK